MGDKTPVTLMYEKFQRLRTPPPEIKVIPVCGEGTHQPVFLANIKYNDHTVFAEGTSKKQAQHLAARKLLLSLEGSSTSSTQEETTDSNDPDKTSENDAILQSLNQYCIQHHKVLPEYSTISQSGPDHMRNFTVECSFMDQSTTGRGSNLKGARKQAATIMLDLLKSQSPSEEPSKNTEDENSLVLKQLNDLSSKIYHKLPQFTNTQSCGPFTVTCKIDNLSVEGTDRTIKGANRNAASKMIAQLNQLHIGKTEEEPCVVNIDFIVKKLNELCQQISGNGPTFKTLSQVGPSHCPTFTVTCTYRNYTTEGTANSIKGAKKKAALLMYNSLNENNISYDSAHPKIDYEEIDRLYKKLTVRPNAFTPRRVTNLYTKAENVYEDIMKHRGITTDDLWKDDSFDTVCKKLDITFKIDYFVVNCVVCSIKFDYEFFIAMGYGDTEKTAFLQAYGKAVEFLKEMTCKVYS